MLKRHQKKKLMLRKDIIEKNENEGNEKLKKIITQQIERLVDLVIIIVITIIEKK